MRSQIAIFISILFLLAQTAFVKDLVKSFSVRQMHKIDNFYIKLILDRNNTKKSDYLTKTYERLRTDYEVNREVLKSKEESRSLGRAMSKTGANDGLYGSAEKISTQWATQYLEEGLRSDKDDFQKKINRGLSKIQTRWFAHSGRSPARVEFNYNRSRISVNSLHYTLDNFSRRSDFQLEFGENVKSVLTYQLNDSVFSLSIRAGF